MKKIVSLLLVFVMVLSSFSMAFAAGDAVVVETTKSNEQLAGDFLGTAGILKGEDGDLKLDAVLTREQGMLMIARLMNKEDEALNNKLTSTFKDAKNNAYWAPVIAWAEEQGLTKGMGDGTFGLGKDLRVIEFQTLALRVLGFEAKWDGTGLDVATVKTVEELGMMSAVGNTFNRGAMAIMVVNTLKATPKDAKETLATTLKVDMTKVPTFVTPSVPGQLGDAKATSAKAVANDKVEVKFDKDVTVSAADFKVTLKSDATKVIEVKEVKAEGTKTVVLTVEGLTAGTAYSVKAGETTVNFTAIAKVTAVPTIKNVKGTDFNRVEVEFSNVMDKATAEDVANYVVDKATVVKATLDADRKIVELETEGLVKNTLYKITIENVKSSDMVAMKKVSKTFRATEDTIAPKVLETKFVNNETVEIRFSKSMDKATLENVANYKIPNLEVLSAKASKNLLTDDTVTIKTATQDVKVSYTLTVEGLKDASVKANALAKFSRTFRGVAVDTIAPIVTRVTAISNTLVKVEVTESNLMDANSVADVANYVVDRDVTVLSAELVADSNKYGKTKEILVTTSAQEKGTYKLTVKAISDEFGNALKAISGTNYRQYAFTAGVEIVAPLKVASIQPNGLNKIVVTFDKEADKTTAQDATNYVFDKDLGAATKATLKSTDAKVVTLETATQKAGTKYTVTINGVQYKYVATAVTVDVKASFIALATEADLTAPTLSYVYAPNKSEIHLVFSEAMQVPTGAIVSAGSVTMTYVDLISDDTTMVFKAANTMTEYTLTAAGVAMKDLAGNEFKLEADTKFYGSSVASVGPTTTDANIEQVNAKKIKVTFDKNIKSVGLLLAGTTAEIDADDKNVVEITKTTGVFEVNKAVKLDFTSVTDMADVTYYFGTDNAKTIEFTPYMSATEAPVMTNATAIHNQRVELTFNEPLSSTGAGSYKIEKINSTTGKYESANLTISKIALNAAADKVILTLNTAMNANEVYYIKYVSAAVNLGGKAAVTKDFEMSFNGTAVVANDKYIGGVSFIGSQKVVVYDQSGNKVTPTAIQVKDAAGNFVAVTTTGALAAGTTIIGHFQNDKTYKVSANDSVNADLGSFEFAGTLAEANAAKGVTLGTVVSTPGAVTLGTKQVVTVTFGALTTAGTITVAGVAVPVATTPAAAVATAVSGATFADWDVALLGTEAVTFTAKVAAGDVAAPTVDLTDLGLVAATAATTTNGAADSAPTTGTAIVSVLTGASEAGTFTVRVGSNNYTVTVVAGDNETVVATKIAQAINGNNGYVASSNGVVVTVEKASTTAITIVLN